VNRNTLAALSVVLGAVALVGLALAAGGAAAQDGSGELVNDTIDVTNETESIYVDAVGNDSMNGSGPVNVTVTVTGLEEGQDLANGTEVDSTTLSVAEGATESYDYQLTDSDREDYDELVIVVDAEDETLIDSADWGSLVDNPGGAGGGLGGAAGSTGVGVLVVLLIGALVAARGED